MDRNVTALQAPAFGRANTDLAHMALHPGNLTPVLGDQASGNTTLYRAPWATPSTRPPNP